MNIDMDRLLDRPVRYSESEPDEGGEGMLVYSSTCVHVSPILIFILDLDRLHLRRRR